VGFTGRHERGNYVKRMYSTLDFTVAGIVITLSLLIMAWIIWKG